ncbi:hypothetical protein POVWA2_017040 [Plasmodium ovale wallikeri]|uniref:Uncharacterized protein n=1 Tax=Plasmodium ovale wallikeri TaxID=864142 RepID=A0A1A8YQW1_PLAOA|nr:hypothetical protein POVWA1_017160 [Plasmodium ovale wallikeri]SBT33886.1 hypothetical protein POVWA2_017040 [Plasmodium ovale wallikeri]
MQIILPMLLRGTDGRLQFCKQVVRTTGKYGRRAYVHAEDVYGQHGATPFFLMLIFPSLLKTQFCACLSDNYRHYTIIGANEKKAKKYTC